MYGLTRQELRFALVLSSSHFAQHVYFRIIPPLIPILAVALAYPLWQLGLLISIYSVGMGIGQAPLGVLSDRVDRLYLLPTGLIVTGAAYVAFAFAPSIGRPVPAVTLFGSTFGGEFLVMSLAMAVVGFGLAVVHPVGYPMISDNVADANKGKVLGVFGAASKFGDAATPAAIAVLILVMDWQPLIVLFGLGGMAYGGALYLVLRRDEFETRPSGQRSDTPESGSASSVMDDHRTFLYPMVIMFFFFTFSILTSRVITTFLPAFIVAVYPFSLDIIGIHVGPESIANVYFAVILIAGGVMQLYLGYAADHYDARSVLVGCMALATVGMIALAMFDLHPAVLAIVVIVLGTGLFGVNPARDALISDISPPEFEGRTFGYIWTAATLVGAIFPTVIGYVLEILGMRAGFLVFTSGTVAAALCVGLLYSDRFYVSHPQAEKPVDASD